MTRKCIMCKGKNYKSACSFFSAPKDAETRRLWQEAINIKDYVVTDDTYVCSKHFNKDDIITHWVSGVPPQVITIKYKKCRLRRGAVPVPITNTNLTQNDSSSDDQFNGIILDGKKYFIDPKKKELGVNNKTQKSQEILNESLNCNLEDEIYEYIPEDSQELEKSENEILTETCKRPKLIDNDLTNKEIIYSGNTNSEILYIDCSNLTNNELKESEDMDNDIPIHVSDVQNILTYFPKKTYSKSNEKVIDKTFEFTGNEVKNNVINSPINWEAEAINVKLELREVNEFNNELNKNNIEETYNNIENINESNSDKILFEDFLEIYNEVSLPSSWFASMVSKGHNTTIVYSCMNISNTGMPYVEKKVFLNKEMTLRCGILNKEIDISNFLTKGKCFQICSISDVEDFIEEFDQIALCTGIIDKDYINMNKASVIYFDGVSWRHSECAMFVSIHEVSNLVCLQCASLTIKKPHLVINEKQL